MNKPVGALAKFSLPFGLGGPEIGFNNKFLAGALDKTGAALAASGPGRLVKAMFHPPSGGAYKVERQALNEGLHAAHKEAAPIAYQRAMEDQVAMNAVKSGFDKEFSGFHAPAGPGVNVAAPVPHKLAGQNIDETFNSILRHAMETAGKSRNYSKSFVKSVKHFTGETPSPELTQQAGDTIKRWAANKDAAVDHVISMGVKVQKLQDTDFANVATREASDPFLKATGRERTKASMFRENAFRSRRRPTAHVPTDVLETIAKNKERYTPVVEEDDVFEALAKYGSDDLSDAAQARADKFVEKLAAQRAVKNIIDDFGDYLGYSYQKGTEKVGGEIIAGKHVGFETVPKIITIDKQKHAAMLAKKAANAPEGVPLYHNNPREMHFKYQTGLDRVGTSAAHVHEYIANHLGTGDIPVGKAYKEIGLNHVKAKEYLAEITGMSMKEIDKAKISQDTLDAVKALSHPKATPELEKVIGGAYDEYIGQPFKANVTMPFPSHHMQNLGGGQMATVFGGPHMQGMDAVRYFQRLGKEMWSGSRFTPDTDPRMIQHLAHGVVKHDNPIGFGDVPLAKKDPFRGKPWDWREAAAEADQHMAEHPWYGENIPYLGKAIKGVHKVQRGVIHTGEKTAGAVEYYNRVPYANHLIEEAGYTPAQAAKEVERLQFDYSSATPLEKKYLKRIFPFYSYTKGVVPLTASTLAQHPGGALAQTIRAINDAQDQESVPPPNVRGQGAIPLPDKAGGVKSYLTGLGLPAAVAAPYLVPFADPGGAGLDLLAATSPLIKYPLEMATRQTFFQRGAEGGGRKLSDLNPTVAQFLANASGSEDPIMWAGGSRRATMAAEHLLANTPATKLLNVARTLSDPRKTALEKAINTLTPARITDVTPAQQEKLLQAASRALAESLGARTMDDSYFTAKHLAALEKRNPAQAADARALKQLWSEFKSKAKKVKGGEKNSKPKRANELLRSAGI
jgi:hypothetical protein